MSAEAMLLGKWRTVELYGRPVSPQKDFNGRPLGLDFSQLSGQWWSANDGCNTTAGRFRLTADGAFHAFDGSSTLVGCSPNWFPRGGQNVKAPQRADQAWLVPAEGDNPARLTLMAGGVTVGLYEALPGT